MQVPIEVREGSDLEQEAAVGTYVLLWAAVHCLTWVLGLKLRSFRGAVYASQHPVICPAPVTIILM